MLCLFTNGSHVGGHTNERSMDLEYWKHAYPYARGKRPEIDEARRRILQHPWWLAHVSVDEVNRIIELASVHIDGTVLVDSRGGYT